MTAVIEKIECLEKLKTEEEELLLDVDPPTPIKRGKGRPRKPIEEIDPNAEAKPKRIMSEKQKAVLDKARQVRNENFQKREEERKILAEEKALKQEQRQKEVERKIIKKAVCVKKKQILEEAILNDELDDEIPDHVIQKVIKKQRAKRATPVKQVVVSEPEPIKSKYTFV